MNALKKYQALITLFSVLLIAPPCHAWWIFGDDGIDYTIQIQGMDAETIERYDLEEVARAALNPEQPPETRAALQAAKGMMALRMKRMLVSEGYYDAQVQARLTGDKENPPVMVFEVEPGTRYVTQRIGFRMLARHESTSDKSASAPALDLEALELTQKQQKSLHTRIQRRLGKAARADAFLKIAESITEGMQKKRCFLWLNVEPVAELDRGNGTADMVFEIKHGQEANFAAPTLEGDSKVDAAILQRYVKWKEGECFSRAKVDATQKALLETRLLASAEIEVGKAPDAISGNVPVIIRVKDRPHRSVTAGVSYGSDEGVGVNGGWEHRNLNAQAHRLTTSAAISQLKVMADAAYAIPYFYRDDQTLNIGTNATREYGEGFDSDALLAVATVERQIQKHWLVGGGGGLRLSRITEAGREPDTFGLIYFPIYSEWDTRDELLDPKEGLFARISLTPYLAVAGQDVQFTKTEGVVQTYLTPEEKIYFNPTLALRAAYGQINGASSDTVPADLRFYAGGGGSVRGYNFRAIGPVEDGEPRGGTLWQELSAELRLRFNDTFGGVAFMDAGSVYQAETFDASEPLFYAAGLGVRYYSPVGPLRLDVGVPLNEVEDDSAFGVYVSLGQAF